MYFKTVNDDVKQNAIKAIQGLEGVYSIEITKYKKDRTKAQNRLYHMWIEIISNETGESHDNLCEIFKLRFLGTEKIQSMGYSIEIPKSTTKLTTQEFTDYLDKIESLALSIDIRLPHPELYNEAMT